MEEACHEGRSGLHSKGTFATPSRLRPPVGGHLVQEFIHLRSLGISLLIAIGVSRVTMVLSICWSCWRWGRVDSCPFPLDDVAELKQAAIDAASTCGFQLQRKAGGRTDVPIDFRFLDLLLRTAGEYAQGVRVGPSAEMPKLFALHKPKKNGVWLLR